MLDSLLLEEDVLGLDSLFFATTVDFEESLLLEYEFIFDSHQLLILNLVDLICSLAVVYLPCNPIFCNFHVLDVGPCPLADLVLPVTVTSLQLHNELVFCLSECLLRPPQGTILSTESDTFRTSTLKATCSFLNGALKALVPRSKLRLVHLDISELFPHFVALYVIEGPLELFLL